MSLKIYKIEVKCLVQQIITVVYAKRFTGLNFKKFLHIIASNFKFSQKTYFLKSITGKKDRPTTSIQSILSQGHVKNLKNY